jgi:hypothetical protein
VPKVQQSAEASGAPTINIDNLSAEEIKYVMSTKYREEKTDKKDSKSIRRLRRHNKKKMPFDAIKKTPFSASPDTVLRMSTIMHEIAFESEASPYKNVWCIAKSAKRCVSERTPSRLPNVSNGLLICLEERSSAPANPFLLVLVLLICLEENSSAPSYPFLFGFGGLERVTAAWS